MALIFTKTPIDWQNVGTEPSDNLKTTGFQAGYRPPADVFNHHFHNTNACIAEIQTQLKTLNGTLSGFNGGTNATAASGGAIGIAAQTTLGGAAGDGAYSEEGGAVGFQATATHGGAVGSNAIATRGGAIGAYAEAGDGFSGGMHATVGTDDEGNYIDAIQLGIGENTTPKTVQAYDYQLMKANGAIPKGRIFSKATSKSVSLAAGTQISYVDYVKSNSDVVLYVDVVTSINTSTTTTAPTIAYVVSNVVDSGAEAYTARIYVQRGTGVASTAPLLVNLMIYEIG